MNSNDKFYPAPISFLYNLIMKQYSGKSEFVFNVPKNLFFTQRKDDFFKYKFCGQHLDSPLGLAAGPHTQMAQNIIAGWLAGARFIELKTIQTLDQLVISKPCIDIHDEGYNCEWSQELPIHQSIDEYAKAFVLIHILAKQFDFDATGSVFNFSIGYNFEGIMQPNVQFFLDNITDSRDILQKQIDQLTKLNSNIIVDDIPKSISNNVTLSTMHGCPPDEIEKIAAYLIEKRKLNTIVKLNPTLLGKTFVRDIIKQSGYNTEVPDIAFEHDLKYDEAIHLINNLTKLAQQNNVFFGIKLTNTLESLNNTNVFDKNNPMMYMSGKPLHLLAINLARKLQNDFGGTLNISFSAGVSAYNIFETIACGLAPVTVCTDILKPGGYGRFYNYYTNLRNHNNQYQSIDDLILKTSGQSDLYKARVSNLNHYAEKILKDDYYRKQGFHTISIKTNRSLTQFDCVAAPCSDTCPTNQNIPQYIYYIRTQQFDKALQTILSDNPLPFTTGYSCDHTCQEKCTRINYDRPVKIRELKRFVSENADIKLKAFVTPPQNISVAIIGGGPLGLSAAYFLCLNGVKCEIFEKTDKLGGMLTQALPLFRLPQDKIDLDIERIKNLVSKIHYNTTIDTEMFSKLVDTFDYVILGVGAQKSISLKIKGADAEGVWNSLEFFFLTRKNQNINLGKNVAVIGGGNTAMDAARIAKRIVGEQGKVAILYRRTKELMPANYEEIKDAIDENIQIIEKVEPIEFVSVDGKIRSVRLYRTELVKQQNSNRPVPIKIENSEFEMNFDSVIVAIGQEADLEFVDKKILHDAKVPFTASKNIFIGGDAIRGASSIIKAIADGKNIAQEILKQKNIEFFKLEYQKENLLDREQLRKLRVIENFSQNIQPKSSPNLNFDLTTHTLSQHSAIQEAQRCLHCDVMCDVCVSVCPNSAFHSYKIENKIIEYPILRFDIEDTDFPRKTLNVDQDYQVFNIADWCNECGNCATFCPTSGKPYKDKPRVHISLESFENSTDGYYFQEMYSKIIINHKKDNKLLKLIVSGNRWECYDGDFMVNFDMSLWRIIMYGGNPQVKEYDLIEFAKMYMLLPIYEIIYKF